MTTEKMADDDMTIYNEAMNTIATLTTELERVKEELFAERYRLETALQNQMNCAGELRNLLAAAQSRLELEQENWKVTWENLKCCGNCLAYDGLNCFYKTKTIYPNKVCPQWQSDGMTRKDREVKGVC
jgi:hypothetical protein